MRVDHNTGRADDTDGRQQAVTVLPVDRGEDGKLDLSKPFHDPLRWIAGAFEPLMVAAEASTCDPRALQMQGSLLTSASRSGCLIT
jgi:hypothetical protein